MSNPSKWIGFVVGAIEVGIGIATGNVALIVSGSMMIVSQAVVDLTAPKNTARQAQEMQIQLGEQPRCALFGECFTAGSLVDAFDFGGKYGTDWECQVIRLADHKCDSLIQFKVNDTFYTYTGDGDVAAFDGEHYNHLHIYFRADTNTDTFPSEVTDNWTGYSASDKGGSGCDIAVLYRCDTPNSSHPLYPGGRPTFGFVVKGKECYDPRLDDTVGGSGSHRWDDPSTWEWSENAAVCRYNYVRGIYANDVVSNPAGLLVGRGLSAAEAPPENIFAAANLCDETVNGKPRYRVAGPVYSNQEFIDVEEMFASATGGSIVTRQGSVELEPGAAKSIVATFTDDDLLVGSKVSWNDGVLSESSDEWINTVVANYVEPNQQWNDHAAPVVRDNADIIADGKPREAQLSLRLVKDVDQAQRVADIGRRLGRKWGRATVTLGPRFCYLEDGDWITYTSARRGFSLTFRIEGYNVDEKWQNALTLREISSDCFDGSTYQPDYTEVATPTTPPPDVGAPDATAGSWALAAVTLTGTDANIPALEITGDSFADDDQVQSVIIEYWKDDGIINPVTNPDDPAWIKEGAHAPGAIKVDITSIEGGADYYAAVTYVVSGVTGDRLVLGPVTADSLDISGQLTGYMQKANNLSDVASFSVSRTNLGATTVGANVFTLTNPSAVTFLRLNADNSVSALSASAFRTAIGAGTGAGDLVAANNLSDLANAGTALTNLGLSANAKSLVAAANYAAMKTLLGLTIGTDVQAYNANLTTYAGIAPSSNVQSVLGAANYAAIKTLLSLTIGTDVQAYSAKLAAIAANTVSSQTGTTYTAVLADADTYIQFSNASAITFTIPPNSSVAFVVGTVIEIEQTGAGALSVAAGAGVTINSRAADLTLAGQFAVAFLKKVATNTWTFNGDL